MKKVWILIRLTHEFRAEVVRVYATEDEAYLAYQQAMKKNGNTSRYTVSESFMEN